jgi:carboxyl-terminal processing protease
VVFFKRMLLGALALALQLPSLGYSEKELKYPQIRQNMQNIFHYHVENKELSPVIVRRSFKIYIEQFDPDKLYLLKEEVLPFLELQDKDVAKVAKQYEKDHFDEYIRLNNLLERSITRHRIIREEVRAQVAAAVYVSSQNAEFSADYARNEEELRQRIWAKFSRLVELREKKDGAPLGVEKRAKFLALYEKKLRRLETNYYLSQEQGTETLPSAEHYQALHILKALTKSLDAHSAYYSSDEAAELRAALKKQFQGIGVVLKESEDGVYISDLITGGPAYLSGAIKVGDVVLAIDGHNVQDIAFEEVLEHLRGDEGNFVELTLKRESGEACKVQLKREKIVLHEERLSYTYEPYADGVIGKICLPGFYDNGEGVNSEKDLREAIRELKSLGPVYGLVIDMRENSGGFLSQAVKVAGLFITKGIIVISKYSDGEIRYMRDLDGRMYYQGPVVLLTSKASASAAEIVAQALQDYGVAVVVGDERTYGKGSMQYQTVTEDDAKAYFKVTVGRYYTISGKSTQIEGVKADILVPTAFSPYNIGERYLEHPLSSDQLDMDKVNSGKSQYKAFQKKYIPASDIKETIWKKMLPYLKANSEKRLAKDENFQLFLRKIRGETSPDTRTSKHSRKNHKNNNFGVNDLQVKESVNIVKDMIYLSKSALLNP